MAKRMVRIRLQRYIAATVEKNISSFGNFQYKKAGNDGYTIV
jgi:hypothetical protein